MRRHLPHRRARARFVKRYALTTVVVLAGYSVSALQSAAQQPTVAAQNGVGTIRSIDELLARRVTVTLPEASLKQSVDTLSHLTGVFIEYRAPMLTAYAKSVKLNVVDTPLGVVLEQVLDGTALRVVGGSPGSLMIVASTQVDSIPATVGTVSGRVVDSATGRGLSAATIKVAGTKITTITQDSGTFVLHNVPTGTQLLAARVFGYRPGERTVDVTAGQPATVRIMLTAVPNVLSGVVTTATGQQRRVEVGNDITTINADSLIHIAPISSVTDILENRVPGLTVVHSSGQPGDPSRIRIRGAGSINGNNDPIVIVDGARVYAAQSDPRNASLAHARLGGSADAASVTTYATPSPLDQIDPNSIDRIEVFKGPSASAMYGSDAANGVIVITTKHGQAGPTHWDANLGAGLTYMPGSWPTNYYRFGYGNTSTSGSPFCAWNDISCVQDSIVAYQALNDPRYSPFADHGSDESGAVTVSGGVSMVRYSLTASGSGNLGIFQMPGIEQQRFLDQYGSAMPHWMIRPSKYNTLGGTGQVTVTPSAKTMVTLSSSLYNSMQQRSSLEQAPSQLEGEYINPLILGAGALLSDEYERATSNSISNTNTLSANFSPTSWLPIYATAGLNTIQRTDKTYVPYGIYLAAFGGYDSTGSYGLGRGTTLDKTLKVGTSIPLPRVTLGIGADYHAGSTNDFSIYTNQLSPGISEPSTFFIPDNGSGNVIRPMQGSADASTYGWYFEPRLNFASKLFVSPGFRLDGGSSSGTHGGFSGTGLTGLPKIDLSYDMIDRDEGHLVGGILNIFRPRIALGVAGTQPSPTDKLRLYTQSFGGINGESVINLNGSLVSAAFISAIGNSNLQPERARELEGGFETGLWNNRVWLTYTRYDKIRHNAILSVPLSPSVYGQGVSQNVNIGEIRNTGTELLFTSHVLQSRMLGWDVGLNFSHRNEWLVHLNPGQYSTNVGGFCNTPGINGTATRLVVGYPLWGRWACPIASYADANKDGVLEPTEIRYRDSAVYVGQEQPPTTLGMTTDLTLFGGTLGVHASLSYQGGFAQYNEAQAELAGNGSQLGNTPGLSLAQQAAIVATEYNYSDIGMIQTVSTLRFDALSINYQVPTGVSKRFRVPHMQLALQGSNLGLHTNYRGLDPNVNAFSTVMPGGQESADTGQIPQQRSWSLHVILGNN